MHSVLAVTYSSAEAVGTRAPVRRTGACFQNPTHSKIANEWGTRGWALAHPCVGPVRCFQNPTHSKIANEWGTRRWALAHLCVGSVRCFQDPIHSKIANEWGTRGRKSGRSNAAGGKQGQSAAQVGDDGGGANFGSKMGSHAVGCAAQDNFWSLILELAADGFH